VSFFTSIELIYLYVFVYKQCCYTFSLLVAQETKIELKLGLGFIGWHLRLFFWLCSFGRQKFWREKLCTQANFFKPVYIGCIAQTSLR